MPRLTRREYEVLVLLVEGLTNKEIGVKLFISPRTVEAHLRHIYEKLHVKARVGAIVRVLQQGMGTGANIKARLWAAELLVDESSPLGGS